ncbi:hypothetical protein Syun_029903 [Stephania yunnanensis]|uniref:beta-ketoacyl-[acyl-carrier-protein] synthase I n=1 Tax=Stephania yunnanensis TaxID=152371 RepID=A0AAP0HHP9_9MAGN
MDELLRSEAARLDMMLCGGSDAAIIPIGEGAGVLLLEELEHAKKSGAKIYAEFLGGSITSDAYHMTEPHLEGTGVVLFIEKALAQSGVSREDNPEIKVNSTKLMIGHLLGAAGAVEAVATIQVVCMAELECAGGSKKRKAGHKGFRIDVHALKPDFN